MRSPTSHSGSCTTHLPAIPKCSLSGQEQPLGALQIILGEAIEVPTKPTNLAPVGTWYVHLHLGLPIPQHLRREAGTGEWGKIGTPGSPRSIQAAFSVSARPLVSARRMGGWKPGVLTKAKSAHALGAVKSHPQAPGRHLLLRFAISWAFGPYRGQSTIRVWIVSVDKSYFYFFFHL